MPMFYACQHLVRVLPLLYWKMTRPRSTAYPAAAIATLEPARLLVITLSNIGDVVLTTPVLEALAGHFPNTFIDIFADARSAQLLAAAPYVGDIFLYNKRAGWRERWRLLRALRRRRYRLVVDLRSSIVAYLLRAEQRLCKAGRRRPGLHAAEEHFATLAPLLAQRVPPPCRLHVTTADRELATQLLAPLPGERWLALAPGANWPGKKWPRDHYRALLTLAAKSFDGTIILGSQTDAEDARSIVSDALPYVITAGTTELRTAAAVLSRAHAFVGNDSGLGHIAAAMGIPTLTPFGPGDPTRYRPWGPRACVVQAPQDNLALLTPQSVWSALEALLDQEHRTS